MSEAMMLKTTTKKQAPEAAPVAPEPVAESGSDLRGLSYDDGVAALSPDAVQMKSASESQGAPAVSDTKEGEPETDPEAKKKAEEEHAAKVTAEWERLLGKWLGGKLSALVLEHLSVDDLNSYCEQGIAAIGPAVGKVLKEETKPDKKQEEALAVFSKELGGEIEGLATKLVESDIGQKILKGVSGWVEDNPQRVVAIIAFAAIGAAIGAYFANVDLSKVEIPFGLPKGWEAKIGVNLGKIQEIGFHGASVVVANKTQKIKLAANYKKEEDKDDAGEVTKTTHSAGVSVTQGDKGKENLVFAINGKTSKTKDGLVASSMDGSLKLVDPENGVTVTIGANGSVESTGASSSAVKYSIASGKDSPFSGKLSFGVKQVTIVDEDGNISRVDSEEFSVAVGEKATKFMASVKHETKDGKETTTLSTDASAQLGVHTLLKGGADVVIGEETTTVKLNGSLKFQLNGKPVELKGEYESDGPITAMVKLGDKDDYTQITGEKKGDVITFSTKQVFGKSSLTTDVTQNKDGSAKSTTTAATEVAPGVGVTVKGGDETSVGVNAKDIGGSGVDANVSVGSDGVAGGVGWTGEHASFNLQGALEEGHFSLQGQGAYEHNGWIAKGNFKLAEDRFSELGVRFGFKSESEFRTAIVGYKRTYNDKGIASDHFDGLFEYGAGRWAGRLQGGVGLQGGKIATHNLAMSGAYDFGKPGGWAGIMGVEYSGTRDQTTNNYQNKLQFFAGPQYGNIAVGGYVDLNLNPSAGQPVVGSGGLKLIATFDFSRSTRK